MGKKLHKVPAKASLTRKSKAKGFPRGTLPAYTADYAALGFTKKQAGALGQLAYAQKQIRKRLEGLESMALATVLGRVEIQGDFHKLSCSKRDDHTKDCDCGSTAKETTG